MNKSQILTYGEKPLNYTVYDVKWIPLTAKFVSMGTQPSGAGIVEIFELIDGKIVEVDRFLKGHAFKCGTFGASSSRARHLATGDFKGRLQIWDLENTLRPLHNYTKHKDVINTIDGISGSNVGCGAPEIATASRDGNVMIWDIRKKGSPVAKLQQDSSKCVRDCWAVALGNSYNSEQRVVCAGYDNGDVKMYDMRTNSIRWEANVKNGICALEFDRKDIIMNKLVITTLEANVHVFDLKTQHPTKGFARVTEKGDHSTVWFVKHLPQNREIFMTAGANGSVNLWKYQYPEKRAEVDTEGLAYGVPGYLSLLQNHTISTQPISMFDWNADRTGLAVCSSFDQTVRVVITTKLNLQ